MTKLDYEEIIALSEDPEGDEDPGQPSSVESLERVAEVADALFYECPFEEKIEHILYFPTDISARRLARMSDQERAEIYSRLPSELVEEITKQLPVSTY